MKKTVKAFRKEQKIKGMPTVKQLLEYAESQNYTVLSYGNAGILCTPEEKESTPAYTARIGEKHYLFYNASLPESDLLFALAHEVGHICLKHMFQKRGAFDTVIHKEQEANRFAALLTSPRSPQKKVFCLIGAAVLVFLSLAAYCTQETPNPTAAPPAIQNNQLTDSVYVTPSGTKYHKADCYHIKNNANTEKLTKQAAEEKNYSPCKTCIK